MRKWLVAIGCGLAMVSAAADPPAPWQRAWSQVEAYVRSPEPQRAAQSVIAKGEALWRSAAMDEKVNLLLELWRLRESISLIGLLDPESVRVWATFDVRKFVRTIETQFSGPSVN